MPLSFSFFIISCHDKSTVQDLKATKKRRLKRKVNERESEQPSYMNEQARGEGR